MRREFGFADTRACGEYVFERLSESRIPQARVSAPPTNGGALESFGRCLGASLFYAVPWIIALVLERAAWGAGSRAPLTLAVMLSLVVCGGFMQAISRRGHLYVGVGQPGLAAIVCAYFVRIGALATVVAAAGGVAVGWLFDLSSWPYLVLWADEFVVLCALWLTWAVLTVRDEHWRVPATLAAGVVAFVLIRAGHIAAFGQLIALGAVLAAAVVQVPRVFARARGVEQATPVPNPRMTVVLFRELPFVLYGTMFFSLLFAGHLVGGRTPGLDLAVFSMLLASAGVEYASLRFAHHLTIAKHAALSGGPDTFRRDAGRVHLRGLAITAFTFVVTASVVAAAARVFVPSAFDGTWPSLAVADAGYFLLALGLLNALVLFTFHRPWSAIAIMAGGLAIDLVVGYGLGRAYGQSLAVLGGVGGGAFLVAASTIAVRRTLRRADHAVAEP
jgi:hypothetical protein